MNRSPLFLIFLIIFMSFLSNQVYTQQADYTLESVFEKIYTWGVEAVGFSRYRNEKSFNQLKDSLIGSTIIINSLPVDAEKIIHVTRKKKTYTYSISEYFFRNSDLTQKYIIDEYSSYHTLAELQFSKYYKPITMIDTNNFRKESIGGLTININSTNDDRLALELYGKCKIKLTGKIKTVKIQGLLSENGFIFLWIEIMEWSKL